MYKGVKTVNNAAPRNNYPPSLNYSSAPPRQWGGRGGYSGGWGRTRTSATGANDTPLGTPKNNSPLPSPALTPKAPPSPEVSKSTQPTVAEVPEKKEKKRKSEGKHLGPSEEPVSKKAKIVEDSEAVDRVLPLGDGKEKKKSKREKNVEVEGVHHEKRNKAEAEISTGEQVKERKERKEKKKSKEGENTEEIQAADKSEKRKRKKEGKLHGETKEKEDGVCIDPPLTTVVGEEKSSKKRKDKREKKEKKSKRASSVSSQ